MADAPRPHGPAEPDASACGESTAQHVLSELHEGVLVFDASGEIHLANPAFARILGVEPPVVGCSALDMVGTGTELGSLVRGVLQGETTTECDVRWSAPDGKLRWLRASTTLLSAVSPALHLLLTREVSELKQLEGDIWQVEKMTALGRLAASVAHEVRNPLSAVHIQLQLLEEDMEALGEGAPQRVFKRLGTARTEMRRLDGIVQNFLRFSRPPALHLQAVHPNDLLSHLHALVEPEARAGGIDLFLDLGSDLPVISADENLLSQALLNILINAFQAVGENPRVELRSLLGDSGQCVVFQIVDNGCGMSAHELEKVMEYYYTTKDTGTGLGLSIAQGIVRQHRGSLDVESTPGLGTSVTLTLPRGAPVT